MTSDRDPQDPSHAHRAGALRRQRFTMGPTVLIKTGVSRFDLHDPYYFAVSLSWPRFFLLFLAVELGINTLFAVLYTLQPGAIANQQMPGFVSAFFFSLETLATVGYGEMYPATLYGHIVSSVEIVLGVIFMAIVTGLLFIRFSKPKAKIVYADNAVVVRHDGLPTLMLRLGNPRTNPLHDVTATLHVMARTMSTEGRRQVVHLELALERARLPAFSLLWTLMHRIDEKSPLTTILADVEALPQVRFFLNIRGRDPAIGQEVSDLHTFMGADVKFGMRYIDAIHVTGDNEVVADFGTLSAIEPDIDVTAPPEHRGVEVDG